MLISNMRVLGLIAAVLLFATGCGNKKNTSETIMSEDKEQTAGHALVIDQSGAFDKGDAYQIKSAAIEQDSLVLTITHGGGCKDHEYTLYTNGALMKSLPPKMNLLLHHNGNEDYCRALIQKRLAFDLSAIKELSSGTIILQIADYPTPLEHTY